MHNGAHRFEKEAQRKFRKQWPTFSLQQLSMLCQKYFMWMMHLASPNLQHNCIVVRVKIGSIDATRHTKHAIEISQVTFCKTNSFCENKTPTEWERAGGWGNFCLSWNCSGFRHPMFSHHPKYFAVKCNFHFRKTHYIVFLVTSYKYTNLSWYTYRTDNTENKTSSIAQNKHTI